MKDFVSRGISVVMLAASLLVVGGVFVPAFPLTGLVLVGAAASLALLMAGRSSAQAPRAVPAPKSTL